MSSKQRKYSPELKAEVVKSVLDRGLTPAQAARDFGLVAETVRNWVQQARKERSGGTTEQAQSSIDQARLAELERRNAELESENAFLKKRPPSSRRNSGEPALRAHRRGEGELRRDHDVSLAGSVYLGVL
ncbi:transposase [Bounagaea algeriensis]